MGLILVPGAVVAQDAGVEDCDRLPLMRPEETFPNDSAPGVTIDAPLRVRYTPGYFGPAGPGGDPTTLITVSRCTASGCDRSSCDAGGTFVPGRVQILGDELIFIPEGGEWDAAATYSAVARGRDGDRTLAFCTGSSSDASPPVLGGLDDVTSVAIEPRCDAPDGGFRVGVFFPPATDTGPPGSIEYLLFQTRGLGVDEPILRDRVRNYPGEQITMAFILPADEASLPICVRVAAVDGVGNFDWDVPNDKGCTDAVQGNFFYGLCSASAPRPGGGSGLSLVVLFGLTALLLIVRRR